MELYTVRKHAVKKALTFSQSRIHYTFDLWTSGNHRAYIAIVAHWLDEEGRARQCVIAFRELVDDHSGSNLSLVVWTVLEEYDLLHNSGYYTLDNASNNDSCLRFLGQQFTNLDIGFDCLEQRLRSFGHILNLTAQALLHGDDLDAFERELETDPIDEEEEHRRWRERGAFGKLRNVVVKVNSSTHRRNEFKDIQTRMFGTASDNKPLSLVAGNRTRWHGDLLCMKRGLYCREAIDLYIARHSGERASKSLDLTDDVLSNFDWNEIQSLVDLLEPVMHWTKYMEGNDRSGNGIISYVLPGIDELLLHFEKAKERYSYSKHLLVCINRAWIKLDKYATLLSQRLYASVLLSILTI